MTEELPQWQEFDFNFLFCVFFKGMDYSTYAGKMNL